MSGFDRGNKIGISKRDLRETLNLVLGKIAEFDPIQHALTFVSEGVNSFGAAVIEGTADNQVKVPGSGTDVFKGVAAFGPGASDLDNLKWNDKDAIGVQLRGIPVVDIEEAISSTKLAVRVRHTNGRPGSFRTTAVAGETFLLTGVEWRSTGTITSTVGKAQLFLSGEFSVTADV